MSVSKTFECENCGAEGKIVIKSDDYNQIGRAHV